MGKAWDLEADRAGFKSQRPTDSWSDLKVEAVLPSVLLARGSY